jgi:hypothetical protein
MKGHFLLLFLFQFCAAQKHESKVAGEIPYCWFNTKYIECLKSKLPCECEKDLESYYSLVIDTNSSSKNFGVALSKYDLLEPNIFPIKKTGQYEYAVLDNKGDASIWAKIFIRKDTIYLNENNVQSVFSKTNNSSAYDVQHYKFDNIDLLNKALTKKGYPRLEEIVKSDSLACYCNKWKGNINFLYSLDKSQSWLLEIKNDSLFIDLVTYPSEDPDPDDPIIPQKFKAYKWYK